MRANAVLEFGGDDSYTSPGKISKIARSALRSSRTLVIQGGPRARNGWAEFQESFLVDDPESARYVAWYYNMLMELNTYQVPAKAVADLIAGDPLEYLPRDFYEATERPENPALVLIHHTEADDMNMMLGAHVVSNGDRLEWALEARYKNLFTRIAAMAMLRITAIEVEPSDPTRPPLMLGWIWRDPKKPLSRHRGWFVTEYNPKGKTVQSYHFTHTMVKAENFLDDEWKISGEYDTNIWVPQRRQVGCASLAPGAWRTAWKWRASNRMMPATSGGEWRKADQERRKLDLNPIKRQQERKKITWFS